MKTITLPADTEHLYLDELAELIAFALWPNSEKNYESALKLLKPELEQAAIDGSLVTKNPLTRQTIPPVMPTVDLLDGLFSTAYIPPPELRIVTVPDLTAYVAPRDIVVVMEAPEQNTKPQAAPEQEAVTPAPVVAAKQVGSDVKPWLTHDLRDPTPVQAWYTPARYYARQLAIEKPTLLSNRELLADKVSTALFNAGFKKRGGKLRFDSGTVLKALANVTYG